MNGVFQTTDTLVTELFLLGAAFILCSLIGIERQIRQKAAGFRTHVLVGVGSAAFTLVSAFGFQSVVGVGSIIDPSRISAQIVSGIGFLGAGVIFTRKDVVRGLTTAATIWVAAAVGMACGAGMVLMAASLTVMHLLTLTVLATLVHKIPTGDRKRTLRIRYVDGRGVLRSVLATTTALGFEAALISSTRDGKDEPRTVVMDIRLRGRTPLREAIPAIAEISDVRSVAFREDEDENED
ncbi:MgtC/SapB family protein [Actinotalea sp. Marseille-Q4924]|uniref:MgtC/SapB family protein n=1 Tax=Actinotalea sp. Marseille-Q4924 TaxID=2866571 RepID=UPI001CE3D948|nr:MgtC/SapB family protein [Actinotalea sp. Marseille-Q4924]